MKAKIEVMIRDQYSAIRVNQFKTVEMKRLATSQLL
jgi:hypothetical protein